MSFEHISPSEMLCFLVIMCNQQLSGMAICHSGHVAVYLIVIIVITNIIMLD